MLLQILSGIVRNAAGIQSQADDVIKSRLDGCLHAPFKLGYGMPPSRSYTEPRDWLSLGKHSNPLLTLHQGIEPEFEFQHRLIIASLTAPLIM